MNMAVKSAVEMHSSCKNGKGNEPYSIYLSGSRANPQKQRFLQKVLDSGFGGCTFEVRPTELKLGFADKYMKYVEAQNPKICAIVVRHAEALRKEISELEPLLDRCSEKSPPFIIIEGEENSVEDAEEWRSALLGRITQKIEFKDEPS